MKDFDIKKDNIEFINSFLSNEFVIKIETKYKNYIEKVIFSNSFIMLLAKNKDYVETNLKTTENKNIKELVFKINESIKNEELISSHFSIENTKTNKEKILNLKKDDELKLIIEIIEKLNITEIKIKNNISDIDKKLKEIIQKEVNLFFQTLN